MTEKELKDLYDHYWETIPDGSGFDGYRRAGICLETGLDFKTVLDVGCGNGSAIEVFTKAGIDVRGLEYSHWMYENRLKDKFPQVIEGDAVALPFPDGSFDLVFSSQVLEHLPEEKTEKAIREMYRVARKYTFNSICYWEDEAKIYHLTIKPSEWWQAIFEKAGFIPIRIEDDLHIYKK